MAILEILEAPHPVLSQRARDVREDEFGPALAKLCLDMAETMYAAPGVGLAAPQVGDSRRILVADPGEEKTELGQKTGKDLIFVVNPAIVRTEGTLTWEESCLSVPEFDVDVDRHRKILLRYRTPEGGTVEQWFEEFPAVVLQHEMDHLDGVTLLDHASRLKRSRYLSRAKKRTRVVEAVP